MSIQQEAVLSPVLSVRYPPHRPGAKQKKLVTEGKEIK